MPTQEGRCSASRRSVLRPLRSTLPSQAPDGQARLARRVPEPPALRSRRLPGRGQEHGFQELAGTATRLTSQGLKPCPFLLRQLILK